MPTQKQSIPLDCYHWHEPKKPPYPSSMNSCYKKKGIMLSASKIEEVERQFDHLFILTKKREGCYYSNITVDFTSKNKQSRNQKREHEEENLTLPIFNTDKKYFTPGFIVTDDRSYYEERSAQYDQDNFDEKKKMYETQANDKSEEKFTLRVPRSQYCYVCKKLYENKYIDHITEAYHSEKLGCSMGQKYINETMKENHFERGGKKKENGKKKKQPRKVKQIQKEPKEKGEKITTRSKKNFSGEDQTDYTSKTRRK